jgi:hypothetical protein
VQENIGAGDPDRRAVVSTRTVEAVVAALLLLFGAVFAYTSVASTMILFHALRGRDPKGAEAFVERGQLRQVLHVLIPAGVFVLGIQLIGVYVASVIYITVFMRWLGKYSLLKSVLLSVAIIVTFFCMFEIWFQVPLYKGLWDLTSWTGY